MNNIPQQNKKISTDQIYSIAEENSNCRNAPIDQMMTETMMEEMEDEKKNLLEVHKNFKSFFTDAAFSLD